MTKYLLTGGAGFIGHHLTEVLLARGDDVVAVDNLSTGRWDNVAPFEDHEGYRFVHGSVLDELAVDELVHEADVVVHLAAAVGVKLIVDQPLRSLITNLRGSETVLEAAHRYRRKVLVASTSEVYGKNDTGPLKETSDRVLGPPSVSRWSYSAAKGIDEALAFAYHKERGLPAVVVRFFNTVGPGQSPSYGMVIPRLVQQALAGDPITVYGDGLQTRCFCHVRDSVAAVVGLLDDERAVGDVFNVGANHEISMLDLARNVVERTGSPSEIVLVPYEQAYAAGFEDMRRRVPDTSKINALTGWKPTRTLDDILDETIDAARREPPPADRRRGDAVPGR